MKVSLLTQIAPENKLLNRLQSETKDAIEAFIAVSFITEKGLKYLFQNLRPILNRKGRVTIFTSGYLRFTEPSALKALLASSMLYKPFLEIYFKPSDRFHAKFLLFEKPKHNFILFVGSSNISAEGLAEIGEMNIQISGIKSNQIYKDINLVIENLKKDKTFKKLDPDLISRYEKSWRGKENKRKKHQRVEARSKRTFHNIPPSNTYPIYVAERYFKEKEMDKIEEKHPKWEDYVEYRYIKNLKREDYFLYITNIKGGEKHFLVSKYLVHDRVNNLGLIAHVKSGKSFALSKLQDKLKPFDIKLNDLLNGVKTKLNSWEWGILERCFEKAFPES